MDILTFYEELKALADRASTSKDPAVERGFIILRVLQATMIGEDLDGLHALAAAADRVAERALAASKEVPS